MKTSDLMADLEKAEAAIKDGDTEMCQFYLAAAVAAANEIEQELDEMDGKLGNLSQDLGGSF